LQAINGTTIAIISTSFAQFFLPDQTRATPSGYEVKVEVFTRFRHQSASVSSAWCHFSGKQKHRRISPTGLKWAHQRKFDLIVFWALDRFTREGTRATLNYLERLESKGVGFVSFQEQWLDSTGPFRDVMISMFASLAKQEAARISERTKAGLRVAKARGKRLGRPPVPQETIREILALNSDFGLGARRISKNTGFP
jgi:hypothetical protein